MDEQQYKIPRPGDLGYLARWIFHCVGSVLSLSLYTQTYGCMYNLFCVQYSTCDFARQLGRGRIAGIFTAMVNGGANAIRRAAARGRYRGGLFNALVGNLAVCQPRGCI